MDMRNIPEVYNTFRYSPMQGISNWIMPWAAGGTKYLSVFPMTGTAPMATTLTSGISAVDTTIPVVTTQGFVRNHGRITIGSEKIMYGYSDSTNFYNCVRGMETSVATSYATSVPVTENNFFIHYCRLPYNYTVENDGSVSTATMNMVLEPCDEHIDGIIKAAAYNIIGKLDPERAAFYKVDAKELFDEYALEVIRGYYDGRSGTGVRPPFPTNESGLAYGGNIMY